jgi:hypothetical protein
LQQLGGRIPPQAPQQANLSDTAAMYTYSPRLIYDEFNIPQRLRYTPWGEPICPDCGQPLIQDEDGQWEHPPEMPATTTIRRKQKRHKKLH